MASTLSLPPTMEETLGQKLRELRTRRGLSLRKLADLSRLNVNTLSLIESGKSSPSVSTLQQLAQALKVPITDFFTSEPAQKRVVFTPSWQRPQIAIGSAQMQNLGKDLTSNAIQPLIITLPPGTNSGDHQIVHTGYEFVYCLEGTLQYRIKQDDYLLQTGDSLAFEAHLPHCWGNPGENLAQFLLVLHPSDLRDEPVGRHFPSNIFNKELTMKIAITTEDGQTISRHFGRAPYYLVLNIEKGEITDREMRNKPGHHSLSGSLHAEEHHSTGHGQDEASHHRHASMAEVIADCQVLICGGMGRGAYDSLRRLNIQPIVTDLTEVETAIRAFLDGKLIDHTELLH